MARKQTRVSPAVLQDLVDLLNNPAGSGDMLKSVYDTDNDGKVDQAEEADTLDGQHASDFAGAGHDHDVDYAPIGKGVTNGDAHDHVGGDGAAIAEGALSLSDVTTGDVSTAKHGFVPKAPNDTAKFLRGDGAWAAPAGGGGLGYTLPLLATTFSPTDGATLYFGGMPSAPVGTAGRAPLYVPKAGTIKAVVIQMYSGTAGTGENWSMYVRKNSTSDTLIETIGWELVNVRVWANRSLSIAVTTDDFIEIKMVCPTWATNPQSCVISGSVYIE